MTVANARLLKLQFVLRVLARICGVFRHYGRRVRFASFFSRPRAQRDRPEVADMLEWDCACTDSIGKLNRILASIKTGLPGHAPVSTPAAELLSPLGQSRKALHTSGSILGLTDFRIAKDATAQTHPFLL
jgi:hypothetical protein